MKLNSVAHIIAFLLLGALNCTAQNKDSDYLSTTLKVERLTNNTFRHISYLSTDDFGKVECNGMVIVTDNEALVIDTPTDDDGSRELIDWIEGTLDCVVIGVVATHFHVDCLGGLAEFHNRKIPSYASNETIELAKSDSTIVPRVGFEDYYEIQVGDKTVISEFLGEGHTIDNIVVYFLDDEVLFGGCLVKELGAGKGYLGDANVEEWSNTVLAIEARYDRLELIVPGHGAPGNTDLLKYTIELFELD